ncbi:MAG TPA: thioredoxin family protein [Armatimonadota bacterium]|nr:thioredoxin family protein [Armatimonadota bacterium]
MRGSRWILLVVILAIVAVFIAKEAIKERSSARPAATIGGAGSAPEETAPGPSAPSAQAKPAPEGKPEGPLPGSRLADCLKSGRPTMADFGKGWCVPCKMMVPVLKQAAQDYWGKANIVFVELDEYADLGRGYRIATMPTQIFFNTKGEEVSRHMGYMGTEDIERELATLGLKK